MRIALAALALLVFAPAAGAAIVETPFEPVPGHAATCLRTTGDAGGLALWSPRGADLFAAGEAGTVRQERVPLGRLGDCAQVAAAPGGPTVAAGWRFRARDIRVAVRRPGAAFGP